MTHLISIRFVTEWKTAEFDRFVYTILLLSTSLCFIKSHPILSNKANCLSSICVRYDGHKTRSFMCLRECKESLLKQWLIKCVHAIATEILSVSFLIYSKVQRGNATVLEFSTIPFCNYNIMNVKVCLEHHKNDDIRSSKSSILNTIWYFCFSKSSKIP